MAKSKNQILQDKLFINKESSWYKYEKDQTEIFQFCEEYKDFLENSKTERLCIENMESQFRKAGFIEMKKLSKAKFNDRIFFNYRNKCLIAFVVGKKTDEFRLIGSHVDSPRLDLKPSPVYEESGLALLQSHYYGGVKKYHWVNLPLALHGIIFTKKGRVILNIGENDKDPKLIIPDLLPHLASEQMKKSADKVIEGEELNVIIGNIPINDEKIKHKVKLYAMKKLNEDYGIVEEDFNFAELELVPAGKPVDIGIDRSMIGSYGQDDRVCAYTSFRALLDTQNPGHTAVALFVDKEEIGSVGNTGAASFILRNFAEKYAELTGVSATNLLEKSFSISADVTAAMHPTYKEVSDPFNAAYLGKGVSVEKYTGGGGKYSTNDANAEYMAYIRQLLETNKIPWQTGELGKIDIGGGGTIAMFFSRYGMDCVDAGPPVLGMHSPCEVTSKADVFSAFRMYRAFFMD